MLVQQIIAKSERVLGALQQKWGELTHNQFDVISGRRKNLLGRIRELHAVAESLSRKQCAKKDSFKNS